MGRKSGQKIKLIKIIEVLSKYTDDEHILNATQICEYLEKDGIEAERKAIYNDIDVLIDYGYDIVKSTAPKSGYFLASRKFELPEIYLLSDAITSAKFISAKKTRELVSKLDSMLSVYQAKKREKGIFFDLKDKCNNEEIYYNIDKISYAIERRKKISFTYFARELSNDREIIKKEKEMVISPYALVWQDDHYYVIGNYSKYDNLIHMRVDRMKSVESLDENVRHFSEVSCYKEYFDIADYTNKLFSMYGGELVEIEFSCNKKILEQVVDRFSDSIFIKNVTENEFCFSTKVALSDALVTWIMNYGDKLSVRSPEKLKKMICDRANEILRKYGN